MSESNKDLFYFGLAIIFNLFSAWLFYAKLINLTLLLIISIGSLIVLIIVGFQLKLNKLSQKVDNSLQKQKKIDETLKIYDRLSKLEATVYYGKK